MQAAPARLRLGRASAGSPPPTRLTAGVVAPRHRPRSRVAPERASPQLAGRLGEPAPRTAAGESRDGQAGPSGCPRHAAAAAGAAGACVGDHPSPGPSPLAA
eukprot:scaffold2900_cov330-Prasinococcus_capsulatus_cf.AAC.3